MTLQTEILSTVTSDFLIQMIILKSINSVFFMAAVLCVPHSTYVWSSVVQLVEHLTRKSGILASIPGLATYFRFSFRFFKKGSVVSYWQKYVHEVLVNRLGGLSLPRESVIRLTDRPDTTLDVYGGRKTTIQQQQQYICVYVGVCILLAYICLHMFMHRCKHRKYMLTC